MPEKCSPVASVHSVQYMSYWLYSKSAKNHTFRKHENIVMYKWREIDLIDYNVNGWCAHFASNMEFIYRSTTDDKLIRRF